MSARAPRSRRLFLTLLSAAAVTLATTGAPVPTHAQGARATDHVVLVSLDGFDPTTYMDPARFGVELPTLKALASNPLVVACVAGILLNASGLGLPTLLAEPLAMLGKATLALGLLVVGAALQPGAMLARPAWTAVATVGKLLAKPLAALGIGLAAGLDATALGVAVLVCAVPTSTTSYILARLLGGDVELMTSLVTTTTILAIVTMPLVLALVS